ncbi:MAG: sporulation protein YunB [Deltaproteobacteria bacterium]
MKLYFWKRNRHIFFIKRKGLNFLILVFMTLFILTLAFEYANNQILPTVIALAESKAKAMVTQIITEVVNKQLAEVDYSDLVYVQKDSQSKVTALQTNIVKMNMLSAQLSFAIQERMEKLEEVYVKVPLWNIFGNTFFSNRGPDVSIKVIPYGNIDADFRTEFVSAGINQTRHKIYMEIKSRLIVVVPLVKKGTEIITRIPVAETVIVGEVPESFVNFNKN